MHVLDAEIDVIGTIKTDDLITKGPWADIRAFGAVGDVASGGTVVSSIIINLDASRTVTPKAGVLSCGLSTCAGQG